MCLALYLASAKPLSTVPWDPAKPAFHVVDPPDERGAVIRQLLGFPHVYYAGSREGCSCAFNYEHEYRSVLELRDYLRKALADTDKIEGFTCRTDRQAETVMHSVTTSPDGIALPEFFFQDSQRVIICSKKLLQGLHRPVRELLRA